MVGNLRENRQWSLCGNGKPLLTGPLPISVVIPSFGRQELVDGAVASVLAQSVPPQEIIVVDDGSSPPLTVSAGVRGLVEIRLLRLDKNSGPAAARNLGMRQARSDWIALLDSDDRMTPESLVNRWQAIIQQPSLQSGEKVAYACGWHEHGEGGKLLMTRMPLPAHDVGDLAGGCWYSPGSCLLMRRADLRDSQLWQDESLRRFEDYDWLLELGLKGYVIRILPVVAVEIQRTRVQSPLTIERTAGDLIRKWRGRNLSRSIQRKVEAYMYLEISAAHYYAGNRVRAGAFICRSLLSVPRFTLQLSPGWEMRRTTKQRFVD